MTAGPTEKPLDWIAISITAALALAFCWEVHVALPVTVDDAYITYSFSKNVALGNGPVYGNGVVVEGYSNFLWMLIVALGLVGRTGADPVEVARFFTLPFMFLLGFSTYRLCRERASHVWCIAAVALLVINSDVITAYQVGLETLPYAALLTLAFMLYVESLRKPRLARWVVPASVAVALMRIDGFLPLGFILVYEGARRLWRREGTWRDYARWALPGVALYLLWFVWRWHKYGLPLPSTYYAKALIPHLLPGRGWEYLRDECLANGLFLALPFAAVLLVRRDLRALPVVLYALGHAAYVVKVGGDWMPYGRFLLPIQPMLLVIIVWGGIEFAEALATRSRRAAKAALAVPAAVLLFLGAWTEAHIAGNNRKAGKLAMAAEQLDHVNRLVEAAKLLNQGIPTGARLVTDYGGVLAYYTDSAPIEMWGLANATIARRGGVENVTAIYGRTCPECYPELDPEFFHVMSPIVRDLQAFGSHQQVVENVWQTDTIGRYLDFQRDFVSGRVMVPSQNRAVYFLERRRPNATYQARQINSEVKVDYPFEPGGRAAGL